VAAHRGNQQGNETGGEMTTGLGISNNNNNGLGGMHDFYVVAQNDNIAANIQAVHDAGKPAIILAPVMFGDVVPNMGLGDAIALGWNENPITKALAVNLRNKTYAAVMLRLFEGGWDDKATQTWACDYTKATAKLIEKELNVPTIIDVSAKFMADHGGNGLYQLLGKYYVCQRNDPAKKSVDNWVPGSVLFAHVDGSVEYTSNLPSSLLYSSIEFYTPDAPVIPPVVPPAVVTLETVSAQIAALAAKFDKHFRE
jgi:hypothetical protein